MLITRAGSGSTDNAARCGPELPQELAGGQPWWAQEIRRIARSGAFIGLVEEVQELV